MSAYSTYVWSKLKTSAVVETSELLGFRGSHTSILLSFYISVYYYQISLVKAYLGTTFSWCWWATWTVKPPRLDRTASHGGWLLDATGGETTLRPASCLLVSNG